MIFIRVELWPHGDQSSARCLGAATIANSGGGTFESGDYVCKLYSWGNPPKVWRTSGVEKFPRRRLGPWDLLLRCLAACCGGRNPDAAKNAGEEIAVAAYEEMIPIILMKEVRSAQKEYFKTRSPAALERSKKAEKALDRLLDEILPRGEMQAGAVEPLLRMEPEADLFGGASGSTRPGHAQ